jgi:ribulose-phosphate 3-epimerase
LDRAVSVRLDARGPRAGLDDDSLARYVFADLANLRRVERVSSILVSDRHPADQYCAGHERARRCSSRAAANRTDGAARNTIVSKTAAKKSTADGTKYSADNLRRVLVLGIVDLNLRGKNSENGNDLCCLARIHFIRVIDIGFDVLARSLTSRNGKRAQDRNRARCTEPLLCTAEILDLKQWESTSNNKLRCMGMSIRIRNVPTKERVPHGSAVAALADAPWSLYPPPMTRPLIIAPSILSADFGRIAEESAAIAEAGGDWLHLDVMDGSFVPNISFGPAVVAAVRKVTDKPLDVHLMISDPDTYIAAFAEAGANRMTVHVEAVRHLNRTLAAIRGLGCKAGVAINPATSEEAVRYSVDAADLVLVMSVNPGFGGQSFLPFVVDKIRRVRALLGDRPVEIEVDGGITPVTAEQVVAAGANALVAGSAAFAGGSGAYRANIDALRAGAERGRR